MVSPRFCYDTATDAELIAYCSDPDREFVGAIVMANKVVKISDHVVVKFGPGVKEEETENLRRAYALLNQSIVRVPRVYRFFKDSDFGYIAMEYINGRTAEPLEYSALAERITPILNHFNKICGSIPGPLGGGVSRGILWDDDYPSFGTIEAMKDWFNTRILEGDLVLPFGNCKMVPCHLDIAPRNILWLEDGSICFLDWASAGFYPRSFEVVLLKIMKGKDGNFNDILLQSMEPLSEEEEAQVWPVIKAWSNTQRVLFNSMRRYLSKPRIEQSVFEARQEKAPVVDTSAAASKAEKLDPSQIANQI